MTNFLEADHVRGLAYTLQTLFGDAFGEDEIETSIQEMMTQWLDSPEYARTIMEAWKKVIAETDPAVAEYLVKVWANRGATASPEEALQMIRQWYAAFQPVWDKISPIA